MLLFTSFEAVFFLQFLCSLFSLPEMNYNQLQSKPETKDKWTKKSSNSSWRSLAFKLGLKENDIVNISVRVLIIVTAIL